MIWPGPHPIEANQCERTQANERRRQQLQDRIVQIQQGEHQLEYLKELYKLNTQIRSPYDGSVLEIMVKPGQLISANTPILSMQADNRKLEARLFLSPAEGKVVETKMEVAISPVSVKKEEYGFMLGRVISVSAFPATQQGMLHILENQALVAEFSQSGPPSKSLSFWSWAQHDQRLSLVLGQRTADSDQQRNALPGDHHHCQSTAHHSRAAVDQEKPGDVT